MKKANKRHGDKPMPKQITLEQFIRIFGDLRSQRFCFILGAGASKSSGIPTGGELAEKWLGEIEEDIGNGQYKKWLKKEKVDANNPAAFYHQIFDKRFEANRKAGFDVLERNMEGKDPSCGYAFLADIMAKENHGVVITTNFDSLTEDALFIYTSKKPLVIGHSGLADFISTESQRPQVIKVHHDLFFSPQNTKDETREIDEKLKSGLRKIFEAYIPIVIGYGGNDGGFMGVLSEVLDQDKDFYWCFIGEEHPKGAIETLVTEKQGCFVPVKGFDELMIVLGDITGRTLLHQEIENVAKTRTSNYQKRMEEIYVREQAPGALLDALKRILKRVPGWWVYALNARKEANPDKQEAIYERGLAQHPQSASLMNAYAIFLNKIKNDADRSEEYYRKALELDPDNAIINNNYAVLLRDIKLDFDRAEKHYLKALELDPDDAFINSSYANFLRDVKHDSDRAEKHYLRALELDPDDVFINVSYANLIRDIKHDPDRAEKYYLTALRLDPDNATTNANYATFLREVKHDSDRAEKYYLYALKLELDNALINSSYARFLMKIKNDSDRAEEYYLKALALDPKHAYINGNYALLLLEQKEFQKAKNFIDKAFQHLIPSRQEGFELILWFFRYACYSRDYPESRQQIERLLQNGIRSPVWFFDDLIQVVKEHPQHPEYDQLVAFAKQITRRE